MNTRTLFASALLAAALPAFAAPIYECAANGRVVYTQNPGSHCKKADIGRVGLYSAAPPAPADATTATGNSAPPEAPNHTQRLTAQRQLEQAQKALEEGRQVRYGNERNYVRYQQRIENLEAAVNEARRKLDALDRPQETEHGAAPQ